MGTVTGNTGLDGYLTYAVKDVTTLVPCYETCCVLVVGGDGSVHDEVFDYTCTCYITEQSLSVFFGIGIQCNGIAVTVECSGITRLVHTDHRLVSRTHNVGSQNGVRRIVATCNDFCEFPEVFGRANLIDAVNLIKRPNRGAHQAQKS